MRRTQPGSGDGETSALAGREPESVVPDPGVQAPARVTLSSMSSWRPTRWQAAAISASMRGLLAEPEVLAHAPGDEEGPLGDQVQAGPGRAPHDTAGGGPDAGEELQQRRLPEPLGPVMTVRPGVMTRSRSFSTQGSFSW